MTTIGFIGLGHMGHPMARNLVNKGHQVLIYDVVTKSMDELIEHGALAQASVAEMAKNADMIFISVQNASQVKKICLGSEGVFVNAKSDLLLVDCSSIDIVTTLALHDEAAKHSISMLDAPVSGGVAAAEKATLTFMVGGDARYFKRALPFLEKMGKKIVHAGPAGHGQAAKICNNVLLGISMIGVCEAFSLAMKLGLDPKKFFEISANASGQCWAMTSYCPVPDIIENVPANRNYEPGFTAKMMLKDLRLGQHAAEAVDASMPLGSVATELYELYVGEGFGEKDFSGIFNLFANHQTETKPN